LSARRVAELVYGDAGKRDRVLRHRRSQARHRRAKRLMYEPGEPLSDAQVEAVFARLREGG
jgi:hypothetical protein